MSLTDELAYMSATEMADHIRRKSLSPLEIIDTVLERIAARNTDLNAFVLLDHDDARARARVAEQAVMDGETLGPLHGVPTAMKDLFDFKPGWPTTFGGIGAFKDIKAEFYCAYAERMEAAGAIIVGKTNSPVLGFRGTCDNYLFGPSRNPFDTDKNTGGSSGGSAAAVADGLIPIAEGTDAGGSIRIPAAWCGTYGFKASLGRVPFVSRPNAFAGHSPFISEGPITRCVADAALSLTALSGPDARDPYSLDEKIDFATALGGSIEGWKIAYSPALDVFPIEPVIADVVENAVSAFTDAGAHVEPVSLGIERTHMELADLWCRLLVPIALSAMEAWKGQGIDLLRDHRQDLPPELLDWVEGHADMKVLDHYRDQEIRTEIFDVLQHLFGDYDLLVTPTLASMPVENATDGNTLGPETVNDESVNRLIGWCLTFLTNFTGHPSASIPAGLSPCGLPVGMQIIGRRNRDVDVLTASAVFEKLRPWQPTYDLCANRRMSP
ncbi:MAG: amidase [Gemmatimonadetes bacterium]|jgi:amidase|nr:amidase [Gemmatimonadota bacterium]MBT7864071.1 amidase [Gemmatimonadota bacterium]